MLTPSASSSEVQGLVSIPIHRVKRYMREQDVCAARRKMGSHDGRVGGLQIETINGAAHGCCGRQDRRSA